MNNQRESLASRLGFILLSAGCAIGLGNVWRFPYITGKYGGALFFVFMSFAAISTLIGVFENIVSYWIDVENVVPSYYAKHPGTWLIQMYYKNPINSNTMDCIGSKYIELK